MELSQRAAAISARSQRSHGDLRNDCDPGGLVHSKKRKRRAASGDNRITTSPATFPSAGNWTEYAELHDPLPPPLSLFMERIKEPQQSRETCRLPQRGATLKNHELNI